MTDTQAAPPPSAVAPLPPLPETKGYRLKNLLLGPPKVSEQLSEERLSNVIAMGVLSPDCISSTAYGTEEILTILVPVAGAAAFTLLMPITIAVIVVLFFVTLSYREVVMIYTKSGGSYVVARENFGLKTAQIAAVALLIDYTVTVAVQSSAGTNALTSAVPSLAKYQLEITVAVVLLMLYGNLRGIREAGKVFAVPTYLFVVVMLALIITGLAKDLGGGGLHHIALHHGALTQRKSTIGHTGNGHGLLEGVALFMVLKSFANGGSSLTGLEAISNGVASFRKPEGINARKTLVSMAVILGILVLGVSFLAHATHATPYATGSPTVLSQEAKVVFGANGFGHVMYLVVQLVTLLILYTGANTSFNGFPFLASFVAGDRFLPMKLTKRGHRLVFSNGIIVLAVVSVALLIVTDANVDALVAVYAIGVFTGFTMAGAGMSKYHITHKERGWHKKLAINGFAAVLSFAVVIIFAVTKFKEGAWIVVLLFPIMWYGLYRLNRRYRREAAVLGGAAAEAQAASKPLERSTVLVMVDRLDLATVQAIQYAKTISANQLKAVHFVIDTTRDRRLQDRWGRMGMNRLPLESIECPDRRVVRAAMERAWKEASDGRTEVTVLLPRRSYHRIWTRLLHDGTGDRIAAALSQIPHVNATIIPFDVEARVQAAREQKEAAKARAGKPLGGKGKGHGGDRQVHGSDGQVHGNDGGASGPTRSSATVSPAGSALVARAGASERSGAGQGQGGPRGPGGPSGSGGPTGAPGSGAGLSPEVAAGGGGASEADGRTSSEAADERPDGQQGSVPSVIRRRRVVAEGRVHSVTVSPWAESPTVECDLIDPHGNHITLAFLGRKRVPGITPGTSLRAEGMVNQAKGREVVINPIYEITAPAPE